MFKAKANYKSQSKIGCLKVRFRQNFSIKKFVKMPEFIPSEIQIREEEEAR